MFRKHGYAIVIVLIMVWGLTGFVAHSGEAASCTVLVVMSVHEEFDRMIDVKKGIDEGLGARCESHYFYLDALNNRQGVEAKAREAYTLYQTLQPDGVIATNEEAQTHFVVPYLKDKVQTPVMFCDMLSEPEQHGYPASNVSGILTRYLIAETIIFAQQLVPSIETVGVMLAPGPASQALARQIAQEQNTTRQTSLTLSLLKALMTHSHRRKPFKTSVMPCFSDR